ncbi:MAG: hypothetical protein IJP37_03735 [Clostridia bacterium]|nr:hypothetical protein [Clostridia bacterium]
MAKRGTMPDGAPYVRLHVGSADLLSHEGKQDIPSDVLGSYTGMAEDLSAPVQDADDL